MMNVLLGVILGIGIFSATYCIYDLLFPSHFVGDMYGMEVMF